MTYEASSTLFFIFMIMMMIFIVLVSPLGKALGTHLSTPAIRSSTPSCAKSWPTRTATARKPPASCAARPCSPLPPSIPSSPSTPIMHNDALPFTLVVFFVIFFFLMLAPMFYAVVMGVREKNLQMERERLVQLYGFDLERIRQDEPLLMEHIHRLIPMIGIVPTIRYVSSAAGLPIDVAQILVCSEPAAPLTSSPYPMAHPGSAAPQVGTRPSYPMSSRPGTTQFQPDEASASDSATREASATRTTTPRGATTESGHER